MPRSRPPPLQLILLPSPCHRTVFLPSSLRHDWSCVRGPGAIESGESRHQDPFDQMGSRWASSKRFGLAHLAAALSTSRAAVSQVLVIAVMREGCGSHGALSLRALLHVSTSQSRPGVQRASDPVLVFVETSGCHLPPSTFSPSLVVSPCSTCRCITSAHGM